jgi:hypothetical protein
MKRLGIVLLCLWAQPVLAADRLPKSMLGRWASDPAACGEQASELAMTVEPRMVLFYEHGLEVRRVVRLKDGSVKASGFMEADGERQRGSLTLKMVGDQLRVGEQTFHRCNSKKQNGAAALQPRRSADKAGEEQAA